MLVCQTYAIKELLFVTTKSLIVWTFFIVFFNQIDSIFIFANCLVKSNLNGIERENWKNNNEIKTFAKTILDLLLRLTIRIHKPED